MALFIFYQSSFLLQTVIKGNAVSNYIAGKGSSIHRQCSLSSVVPCHSNQLDTLMESKAGRHTVLRGGSHTDATTSPGFIQLGQFVMVSLFKEQASKQAELNFPLLLCPGAEWCGEKDGVEREKARERERDREREMKKHWREIQYVCVFERKGEREREAEREVQSEREKGREGERER